jgi:hypothetical protein
MIAFFNKFRIGLLPMYALMTILICFVTSCSKDELEIQNDFPFEVKMMPVPKEIANGTTAEIRITIQPTGNYSNAQYYLRYFQFDGQGTLQYNDEPPYLPNDLYQLPIKQFRLYYTSHSTVSQSFDVWILDDFGNEKQLSFKFNSSD